MSYARTVILLKAVIQHSAQSPRQHILGSIPQTCRFNFPQLLPSKLILRQSHWTKTMAYTFSYPIERTSWSLYAAVENTKIVFRRNPPLIIRRRRLPYEVLSLQGLFRIYSDFEMNLPHEISRKPQTTVLYLMAVFWPGTEVFIGGVWHAV